MTCPCNPSVGKAEIGASLEIVGWLAITAKSVSSRCSDWPKVKVSGCSVYAHICVWEQVCILLWVRRQRLMLGIFLKCSTKVLDLFDWITCWQGWMCISCLYILCWSYRWATTSTDFYMDSGFWTHSTTHVLPAESSPQTPTVVFNNRNQFSLLYPSNKRIFSVDIRCFISFHMEFISWIN